MPRCQVVNDAADMLLEILFGEARNGLEAIARAALECSVDRFGDHGRIFRIHQRADRTISQRIDAAVAIAPDDRNSACGRLQKDDAEALLDRWHDEDIGGAEVVGQFVVGHLAGEDDAAGTSNVCATDRR